MGFIVDRPGLSLLVVGLILFLLRNSLGWIPLVGGVMTFAVWIVSIFFIVGGVWMFFMNRAGGGDPH